MSEVVIPSAPNWFLSNCICIGSDGYIIYGTLSVGIGILIPSGPKFIFKDLKVIRPAHKERVNCLSLSTDWLESRLFVSGADDGYVKLWSADTLSSKIAHNTHNTNKESVVGVAFLDNNFVVSVGSIGFLTVWYIKPNAIRNNQKILKSYKPVCMSVCPHKEKVVAVGTKQGVVVVLSVSDTISILFKCPGHDSEITSLSWCPTLKCDYFDNLKSISKINYKKGQHKVKFDESVTETINEVDTIEVKNEEINVQVVKDKLDTEEIVVDKSESEKDDFLKECNDLLSIIKYRKNTDDNLDSKGEESHNVLVDSDSDLDSVNSENGDKKNCSKVINSIEDDNDTSIRDGSYVVHDESDIFDIYEDNAFDEFGHTNNLPDKEALIRNFGERKIIKAKKTIKKDEQIQEQDKIENLVKEVESLNIDNVKDKKESLYLASCCKKGNLCIWRWGGTLLLSEDVKSPLQAKFKRKVSHPFGAALWIDSTKIIAAAKDSQLVHCAFEDKMNVSNLHNSHKRGLYTIVAKDKIEDGIIWTASMDRLLAGYSLTDFSNVVYSTFGGFVYDIQLSKIDPNVFAVGCGDGVIRVFKMSQNKEVTEAPVCLHQFWNGINGKVLSLAWHPTKENCLAFSTIEGRVGILNASVESPPKIMPFSLPLGVYHICWGLPGLLFACGGGNLVVYDTKKAVIESQEIDVKVLVDKWKVSTMNWTEKFLSIGSPQGGLALLSPNHPFDLKTFGYPHKNAINAIEWHPIAVTTEDGVSPYADLVAISAKSTNVVVMKLLESIDGEFALEKFCDFTPHVEKVTNLCWSPHHNGRLLSTSHDHTIQIWDVLKNCLLHSFVDHQESVMCANWCLNNTDCILSGGEDCSVRIWNVNKHSPLEKSKMKGKQKKKMILAKLHEGDNNLAAVSKTTTESTETIQTQSEVSNGVKNEESINLASVIKTSKKSDRKILPLVITWKEYKKSSVEGCRRLFDRIKSKSDETCMYYEGGYNYLKVFGNHTEVMELLDFELNGHKETFYWDAWIIVGVLKGDLRGVLELAAQEGKLSPSLLSLAPSVSHRFWKDTMATYCNQLECGDVKKLNDQNSLEYYGKVWQGLIYLSVGQIEEGCSALASAGLELEAIIAAKARHVDHIAEKQIEAWAKQYASSGSYCKAAECYLSLGMVMDAANVLGKSNDESDLALAAEMAKYGGNLLLSESMLPKN